MSQHAFNQILQIIRSMLDAVNVGQKNPQVYTTFLNNISNPQSDLSRMMMDLINRGTGGQWVHGVNPQAIAGILRPWINEALSHIESQFTRNTMMQPGFGNQGYPQQNYGYQPPPQPGFGTTGSLYDNMSSTLQQPVSQMEQFKSNKDEGEMALRSPYNRHPMSFEFSETDPFMLHEKPDNVVTIDQYLEGSFETIRIAILTLTLNTSENSSEDAAKKAAIYSPNEAIRGKYANVIKFKHLVHIPIGLREFQHICAVMGEKFYNKEPKKYPDWRSALDAMESLKRGEYKAIERAFLEFVNPSMFKYLRTSDGNVIEGIEEMEDLRELDNPKSKLKVTKHANYSWRLDETVTRAFDNLINPTNLITPEDKNFGDFIHCDKIEFWKNEKSKYDYGTFIEKIDRDNFIEEMIKDHTVLRVNQYMIFTNALDYQQVKNIARFRTQDFINLDNSTTVGHQLLYQLDQPKSSEIESVVCSSNNEYDPDIKIHLGYTLDGDRVLIR